MENGDPGCDTCASTPLARAINQLSKEGKPFSNLCACYFKDASATLRWLGVIVQSAGNRLIYFPGFLDAFDEIEGFHRSSLQWQKPFLFDHICLERGRSKWHITSRQSKDHLGSLRSLPLGLNRSLWFGMSVGNARFLRVVKQEVRIEFDSPPSDSHRRGQVFRRALEGAKSLIISLNDENPIPFNEWFLHFAFIVGPKDFEDYWGDQLGFPWESPYLIKPLPKNLPHLPVHLHRMELSDDTDVQITVCCLPGEIGRAHV